MNSWILGSNYWYLPLVPILNGSSEIGAHVRSNLCDLICLRHLIKTRAVTNRIFSPKRFISLHACAICFELPSHISTMLVCYLLVFNLHWYDTIQLRRRSANTYQIKYKEWSLTMKILFLSDESTERKCNKNTFCLKTVKTQAQSSYNLY